jgi:hypothetical protein
MTFAELVPGNELLARPSDLRARMDADGFVFFRGLLPRDDVLALRRVLLECCRDGGWLVPGGPLEEGRADPARATAEPEPAYNAVYHQVQRRRPFHALGHHPTLLGALGAILGEAPLPHPLKIARLIFPRNVVHTTPPHQDYPFIQGTPETYTAWIPLGDCPRELGGLQVNRGTHRAELFPHHVTMGAGGMGIRADALPEAWHSTDYRAGDVLVFHSRTVHRGLPNLTPDRLRLSVDYRYQSPTAPICESSLRPHMGELTWEEVYRDWPPSDLPYYWRRHALTVVPYDRRHVEARDREAFELAAAGDPVARPALLRIAQRDRDPARRERARRALAALESASGHRDRSLP